MPAQDLMVSPLRKPSAFALALALVACVGLFLVGPAHAKKKRGSDGTYDEGRLINSYYGDQDFEWRETDEIDYLWVRDGFDLSGKSVRFADWPAVEFHGPKADDRDAKDKALARELNGEIPRLLADAFGNEISGMKVVKSGGDVVVDGRIVDCSTGSRAAKMLVGYGAGAGSIAIDVTMKDAKTGELLGAFHHRVVSGTNISSTESKFGNWLLDAAESIEKAGGLQAAYAEGDRRKK